MALLTPPHQLLRRFSIFSRNRDALRTPHQFFRRFLEIRNLGGGIEGGYREIIKIEDGGFPLQSPPEFCISRKTLTKMTGGPKGVAILRKN